MDNEADYYAILGVSPASEDVVIKAAYRALMRRYHPDTNTDPDAIEKARKINEAYEVLGNPERRNEYDASQRRGGDANSRRPSEDEAPRAQARTGSAKPGAGNVEKQEVSKGNALAAFGVFAAVGFISVLVLIGTTASREDPDASYGDTDEFVTDTTPYIPNETEDLYSQLDIQAEAMEAASAIEVEPPLQEVLSSSPTPVSFTTVESSVHRLLRLMDSSGMIGARKASERCHESQENMPTWDGLDSCAAFDFAAAALDKAVTSSAQWNRNAYFEFQAQNQADYYQPYSFLARERLNKIKRSAETALSQKVRETAATREKAEAPSQASQSALVAAIVRQVRPHWRAPSATGVSDLVTTLSFQLARDGSLVGEPRVVSQEGRESVSGYVGDLHAEYAIRAVKLAGPFKLPEDQYETWKTVSLRFDSKL